MSFKAEASAQFPGVKWTGGSHIHVSRAYTFPSLSKYTREDIGFVMKLLEQGGVPQDTYHYLTQTFQGFEWLFAPDQFHNLFMVDIFRHFQQLGSCYTDEKFQNPVTGNWFHKIALMKGFTGGFRNWVDDDPNGHIHVGWRFRIVGNHDKEGEIEVRERAAKTIQVAQEEMAQVIQVIQSPLIKEPTLQEIKEAQKVYEYN